MLDVLNQIATFLANPVVSWGITAIFAIISVFFKVKVTNIKAVVEELLDIAKVQKEATDPKSENGVRYSKNELAKMEKELQELLGDLAVAIGREKPVV